MREMLGMPSPPRKAAESLVAVAVVFVLIGSLPVGAATAPHGITSAPSADLHVGFLQSIQSLNPFQGYDEASLFLYGLLYDYPFSFDQNGSSVGNIVTSATPDTYGFNWTYTVRQGVIWSDGTELTANDTAFTWNYDSQNLGSLYAYEPYFNQVVQCSPATRPYCGAVVSLTNPWNVTVYFQRPFAAGRALMAPILQQAQWGTITPGCAQGSGSCSGTPYQNSNPIGTGPFIADPNIYQEFIQLQPLHLTRNPRYHAIGNATPAVNIANLYLSSFGDPNSLAAALLAGTIDVAQFTPLTIGAVVGQPNVLAQQALEAYQTFDYIGISQFEPGTALNPARHDINVRRAMAVATNKDYIIQQFYNGQGARGSGVISPITPAYWYDPVAGGDNLTFDIAAANALLNATGYTTWSGGSFGNGYRRATSDIAVNYQPACFQCVNPPNATKTIPAGTQLTFTLATRPQSEFPEEYGTALYLQAEYARIGIDLVVLPEPTEGSFASDVYNGNVEMYIWFWSADPDPNYLLSMQSSWTLDGWNDNYWNNASYNHEYLAQLADLGSTQRIADALAAQKIHYDMAPYIVTLYPFGEWAMRTDLWTGWGDWAAHPYRQLNVPWGANPLFFDLNCPSCAPVNQNQPPTPPVIDHATYSAWYVNDTLSLTATSSDPETLDALNFTWDWADGTTTYCPHDQTVANCSVSHSNSTGLWSTVGEHAWNATGNYTVRVSAWDGWSPPVVTTSPIYVNVTRPVSPVGWLAGVILDTSNRPIPGAHVSATPGGATSAPTGSNGAYNMTLVPGTYSVTASASFYLPVTKNGLIIVANTTTSLNFVLATSIGWIDGSVVDASTGAPVSGAAITATDSGGGQTAGATDGQGRFNITVVAGAYTVTVAAVGYTLATQAGILVVAGAASPFFQALAPSLNPIQLALTSVLGQPGQRLTFFANTTSPASGAWVLDFGDGTNATGTHGMGTSPVSADHSYAAEGNFTVTLTATSYLLSAHATAVAVVDGTPPVTQATFSRTAVVPGWYRGLVTVTLSASDDRSGVESIRYRVDGGPWQEYTTSISFSGDGSYTLEYQAADRAGNLEALHTLTVGIDTTPPQLVILPLASTTLTSSRVTVEWLGKDLGSGIASFAVSVDGGPRVDVGMNDSFTTTLADGTHTITVWAFDIVGNNVSNSITVTVDTNPFSPSGPYAGAPTYAVIAAAAAIAAFVLWRRRRRGQTATRQLSEQEQT